MCTTHRASYIIGENPKETKIILNEKQKKNKKSAQQQQQR